MEQLKLHVDNSGVIDLMDINDHPIDSNGNDVFGISDNNEDEDDEQSVQQRKKRRLQLLQSVQHTINTDNSFTNINGGNSISQPAYKSNTDNGHVINNSNQHNTAILIQKSVQSISNVCNNNINNGRDEDEYDLFSDSPSKLPVHDISQQTAATAATGNTNDINNEFYQYKQHDKLNDGRYIVTDYAGSGVFSTVVRAIDTTITNNKSDNTVVIKLLQNNNEVLKSAQNELNIIQLLQRHGSTNKYIIQLKSYFMYHSHLCLVFESMNCDTRKLNKQFGSIGISIHALHIFTKQLCTAIKFIHKYQFIHCDIKPDNILINHSMNTVKLSDFGSCIHQSQKIQSTLVCSRYYRPPDVILGNVDKQPSSIDIWSLGCVLYELYTGDILFSGSDNTDMLIRIMDTCGMFPLKLVRNNKYYSQYYNDKHEFTYSKYDTVTNESINLVYTPPRMKYSIYELIKKSESRNNQLSNNNNLTGNTDQLQLQQLSDFIEKCLILDPVKRWTADQLLKHSFITNTQ